MRKNDSTVPVSITSCRTLTAATALVFCNVNKVESKTFRVLENESIYGNIKLI